MMSLRPKPTSSKRCSAIHRSPKRYSPESMTRSSVLPCSSNSYSTFLGRRGLYLEDLFIRPASRGKGYGRRLLIELARIAVERGCGRVEWSVLDWNDLAQSSYRKVGALPMEEWTVWRLTGADLVRLAEERYDDDRRED